MYWCIPALVLIGVAAGPVLGHVGAKWLRRLIGWSVLIGLVISTDQILADASAFNRMLGICCVLLGGMKGMVYAEWVGRDKLSLAAYCVFAFCWFGMDVGSFKKRRQGLSWRGDIYIGLCMMLLGGVLAWLVWYLNWQNILVVFVPLSMSFHFGALRMMKGCIRLAGYPVRTLFPNVLKAEGIADFWSRRWNVGYSQMMQRVVCRPVEAVAGKQAGVFAVFLISGVLHELAITLPVQTGYGLPTLYFTIHGLFALIEKRCGRSCGKIPALLAVALPLGWLFPTAFKNEILLFCYSFFDLI